MRYQGPQLPSKGNYVIIMNHRTRLDWIFALVYTAPESCFRIALKESLANLPGLGWLAQCQFYLFLRRNLKEDLVQIDRSAWYYSNVLRKTQLLFFPEGTDLTQNTSLKSHSHVMKTKPHRYTEQAALEYTISPKTAGFLHVLNANLGRGSDLFIFDASIMYPDGLVQNETDLLFGLCSPVIDIKFTRYNVLKEVPICEGIANQETADWLIDRWIEKENYLKKYYEAYPEIEDQFKEIRVQETKEILHAMFWLFVTAVIAVLIMCTWNVLVYYLLTTAVLLLLPTLQNNRIHDFLYRLAHDFRIRNAHTCEYDLNKLNK
ncbi:hypothetical protein Ciccas_008335 [Cichlidogyrus casuarinus]|uniref:Phospholipid/glycerol acyltransferase domain-containing protein n=1 Tax=Cichlidogyrus casuarinus TaxID=1844966 RepID=A0ABD2Q091_9PLAT